MLLLYTMDKKRLYPPLRVCTLRFFAKRLPVLILYQIISGAKIRASFDQDHDDSTSERSDRHGSNIKCYGHREVLDRDIGTVFNGKTT